MKNANETDFTREHDLTIEEIRVCSVFRHLTDEEAKEVIKTLKQFTVIVYNFYKRSALSDG